MPLKPRRVIEFGMLVYVCMHTPLLQAALGKLDITINSAPIVPHGLLAGAPMDITLSFVDLDPVGWSAP